MTVNDLVVTKRIIPSYDVRKYIKDIGHEFSCRDAVYLIEDSFVSLNEKATMLKCIKAMSDNDYLLEEYIDRYIDATSKSIKKFMDHENKYIYKLVIYSSDEFNSNEYFLATYNDINNFYKMNTHKNKYGMRVYKINPLDKNDYDFHIEIDEYGLICFINRDDFDRNEEKYKWAINAPYIPHPFRKGDHVYLCDNHNKYGVVVWPTEKEYELEYKTPEFYDETINIGSHKDDSFYRHYKVRDIEYDKEKDS